MASKVEIANRALSKLGEKRITSLNDDVKAAREINACYDLLRDQELRAHTWHFAKARTTLAALADEPAWGWEYMYAKPADFLRLLQIGYSDPVVDTSDLRTNSSREWTIEGDYILTNHEAPLPIRYVARVTDPNKYDVLFIEMLACRIGWETAFAITGSATIKDTLMKEYQLWRNQALLANVIELPPAYPQDGSWMAGR